MGMIPDPRQIGDGDGVDPPSPANRDGDGDGPPIPGKSGMGMGMIPRSPANRGWDPHPHPRTNRGWGWGWGSGVPRPGVSAMAVPPTSTFFGQRDVPDSRPLSSCQCQVLSGRIFGARCWEDLWGLEIIRDPCREADSECGLRSHDPDTPCQCPNARPTLTVACEFPQDRRREGPAGPRVRGILRSSARARWHVHLRLRLSVALEPASAGAAAVCNLSAWRGGGELPQYRRFKPLSGPPPKSAKRPLAF
jgi:hypothetical protein